MNEKRILMPRREMLALSLRSIGSIALAAHGCSFPASVTINSKSNNIGGVSVLGLRKGITSLRQTIALLKEKRATGISISGSIDAENEKVIIHALTADNIGKIILFRDGTFAESINLKAKSGSAKNIYLKLTRMGKSNAIIVLSGDLIHNEIPGMLILTMNPKKTIHISSNYFEEWLLYGMKDPLIIGNDISEGVTFVARKATGIGNEYLPWHFGIILKCDGKKLKVETKLMERMLSCECTYDWFNNPPEKRKKDTLVAPFLE